MSARAIAFSDTHRDREAIRQALPLLRAMKPDALLFLGDGDGDAAFLHGFFPDAELCAVRGNCDYAKDAPWSCVFVIEGVRLYLTHGHAQSVKGGLDLLCAEARAAGCDAALYGHTHRAAIDTEADLLLVNPGSLSRPRGERPGFALLLMKEGKVEATQMWC